MAKNNNKKNNARLSASARRARKITAKVKEPTGKTLRAVRAGRYA